MSNKLNTEASGQNKKSNTSPFSYYKDDPDLFLSSLLEDSNNRYILLKLEKNIEKFISQKNKTTIKFFNITSFHRRIIHNLAEYYHLIHYIIYDEKNIPIIVISKHKDNYKPNLTFNDIYDKMEKTTEKTTKNIKIMKRTNSNSQRQDKKENIKEEFSISKETRNKEEEYEKARKIIFGGKEMDIKQKTIQQQTQNESKEDAWSRSNKIEVEHFKRGEPNKSTKEQMLFNPLYEYMNKNNPNNNYNNGIEYRPINIDQTNYPYLNQFPYNNSGFPLSDDINNNNNYNNNMLEYHNNLYPLNYQNFNYSNYACVDNAGIYINNHIQTYPNKIDLENKNIQNINGYDDNNTNLRDNESIDRLENMLEVYGYDKKLRNWEIDILLSEVKEKGATIKWVDRHIILAIFRNSFLARLALKVIVSNKFKLKMWDGRITF